MPPWCMPAWGPGARPLALGGGGGLGGIVLASVVHWLWDSPELPPLAVPACASPWFTGELSTLEVLAVLFDRPLVASFAAALLVAVFLAGACCGGAAGVGVGFWLGRRPTEAVALRAAPALRYRCPE